MNIPATMYINEKSSFVRRKERKNIEGSPTFTIRFFIKSAPPEEIIPFLLRINPRRIRSITGSSFEKIVSTCIAWLQNTQ